MKLQEFIDSGFIGKSVDKIKGSSVGIYIDPSSREVSADSYVEAERQKAEKLAGKKLWVINKGASACVNFFESLFDAKSPELRPLGDGYYELSFGDFSLYHQPCGIGWTDIYMDAREVILPLKKKVEYSSPRGYIVSLVTGNVFDGNRLVSHYFLPYLTYPKAVLPFLEWAMKKKKLTLPKGKLALWNKNQKISNDHAKSGLYNIDSWVIDIQSFGVGVPMSNIKTREQVDDFNTGLKTVIKPTLEKSKKDLDNCPWVVYRDKVFCPDHINVSELGITQEMIDEYVNEANSITYKVLR